MLTGEAKELLEMFEKNKTDRVLVTDSGFVGNYEAKNHEEAMAILYGNLYPTETHKKAMDALYYSPRARGTVESAFEKNLGGRQ